MSRSQDTLIAQIRLVMQSLIAPAPHLLAVLAEVEQLDVTQVQLPVVEFSPFSTLSVPQTTSRDNTTEPQQRASIPTVPFATFARKQEATATASDTVEHPPPVFSLRSRPGDQPGKAEVGQTQSVTGSRPATVGAHEPLHHREGNAHETNTKITEKQQARVEFSSLEKPQMPALGEQKSFRVNSDTLSWVEFATQALNGIATADSSRGAAPSNFDINQTATNVSTQTVHDAKSETVGHSHGGESEVLSSPLSQRDNSLTEMSVTRMVDSQTRLVSQPPPITRMGSVNSPADTGNDSLASQLTSDGTSLGHIPLDAEEIAALVNDILVEQARRNGVDLS